MLQCLFFFRAGLVLLGLFYSMATLSESYFVNPGDTLRIDVWDEERLSREVLVRPDGIISLPMAGTIDTKGSTPSEVEGKISEALGNFMKEPPRVVVSLVNVDGNKIYVIGKVTEPGEYVVTSAIDVMQALSLAGGLAPFAAENDIIILRRQSAGKQVGIPFRYGKVKSGKELETNILLRSRDVVVVP